jgi:hypothetical protein
MRSLPGEPSRRRGRPGPPPVGECAPSLGGRVGIRCDCEWLSMRGAAVRFRVGPRWLGSRSSSSLEDADISPEEYDTFPPCGGGRGSSGEGRDVGLPSCRLRELHGGSGRERGVEEARGAF